MRDAAAGLAMHRLRPHSRGLAEIVGTLMLVVIVVAAATAFSFFVAAYQKQLQSQEALEHDKSLEKIRILTLEPAVSAEESPYLRSIIVEIASLDVNTIVISGILLSGDSLVEYNVTDASGNQFATGDCLNGNRYVASNASCNIDLAPEAQVFLQFDVDPTNAPTATETAGELTPTQAEYSFLPGVIPYLTQQSLFTFEILTTLGNQFTQPFVPPVALAGLTFVSSYPILDGSNSYQPTAGTAGNISIDQWNWVVTGCPTDVASDCGQFSGQEYELPLPFTAGTYDIALTVVNTESLQSSTEIQYTLSS